MRRDERPSRLVVLCQRRLGRCGILWQVQPRRARPSEAEEIRALVERAYERYVERIGRRPAPMDEDYAEKVREGHVDVIEQHGKIVGVIVLIPDETFLLIENVAVDPAHQGRGIGRQLLAHAEIVASLLQVSELRLYTNAAMTENLELYPRLGYREADRRTEDGFERVFFCKPTTAH